MTLELESLSKPLLSGDDEKPLNAKSVLGSTVPRLWTPPLRELVPAEYDRNGRLITEPTSLGFDIIDFARDDLNAPLDPWQEWTVIHGFELLPDGRTRFKKLLILVSRQNGKTHLCVVLTLYWMYVQRVEQILGTSTKLEYAKDAWNKAKKLAKRRPELRAEISHRSAIKTVNGGVDLWRADAAELEIEAGSHYKIAPANEDGGRSQTNDRVVFDELRHHYDYSAYDAAEPTTSVPWSSMIVGLSNAGNDRSVVLNDWRAEAIEFINTGEGDPRLGLIEYSAPENAKPTDILALAQANPNLNRRGIDGDDLVREGAAALRIGGEKLVGFKTEKMCIHVPKANPAVSVEQWDDCFAKFNLATYRNGVVLCFDFSLDELHATLVAASMMENERVGLKVVKAWGPDDMRRFAAEFRAEVTRANPRALGWFQGGPAAAQAAVLLGAEVNDQGQFEFVGKRPKWMPRRTELKPLQNDAPAACMGFAKDIRDQRIAQPGNALLDAQIPATEKQQVGARWVANRLDGGHCDAYYACSGANYLARLFPPTRNKPRLISAS